MKILVIHGPNMHLLGKRQPEIYGKITLKELNALIKKYAASKGIRVKIFQSNCEGEIIDIMTSNINQADALIINPAAFTHYSYAIRDAIEALNIPAVEVHLTDICAREPFRRKSVIKKVCVAQFKGEGPSAYLHAIYHLTQTKNQKQQDIP